MWFRVAQIVALVLVIGAPQGAQAITSLRHMHHVVEARVGHDLMRHDPDLEFEAHEALGRRKQGYAERFSREIPREQIEHWASKGYDLAEVTADRFHEATYGDGHTIVLIEGPAGFIQVDFVKGELVHPFQTYIEVRKVLPDPSWGLDYKQLSDDFERAHVQLEDGTELAGDANEHGADSRKTYFFKKRAPLKEWVPKFEHAASSSEDSLQ